ncbi:hypothetical protein CEXT_337331 [Caerostris extrusa]|uniref:Uncharacterized protein n=1 Tax=Caerostris extrusa TaxID=172846 RepID=A0AAV4NG90_CAEEX|nr:hypothetical protein CEXT_337331 [Caerostris extrusa]
MITDEGLYRGKDVYAVEYFICMDYIKSHTNAIYGTRDWTQKSLRAATVMGPNRSVAKPDVVRGMSEPLLAGKHFSLALRRGVDSTPGD